MPKLLLIEDRDGDLETSLHESGSGPDHREMRQPLARVRLSSIIHNVAKVHMERHPHRAVLEKHQWLGPSLGRFTRLEKVLSGMLTNMEGCSPESEPIEVVSGRGGSSVTVVMRSRHSDQKAARDLQMWDMADNVPSAEGKPLEIALNTCREIVEAMGGEIWSSPCRPAGSALVITLPSRPLGNGRSSSVLGLPSPDAGSYIIPGVWSPYPAGRATNYLHVRRRAKRLRANPGPFVL